MLVYFFSRKNLPCACLLDPVGLLIFKKKNHPVRLLDPVHLFISEKFLLCAIIFLKKIHLTFLFFASAGNV